MKRQLFYFRMTGRADSLVSDPEDRLPAETLSATEQRAMFAGKGFTTQELVAILGAHTVIHCI